MSKVYGSYIITSGIDDAEIHECMVELLHQAHETIALTKEPASKFRIVFGTTVNIKNGNNIVYWTAVKNNVSLEFAEEIMLKHIKGRERNV